MGYGDKPKMSYFSFKEGKVIKHVDKNTVETYTYVEGWIRDIKIQPPPKDHPEYGDQIVVHLNDGTEDMSLRFKLNSGYGTNFLRILPNVQASEPVTFTVSYSDKDGQKKVSLFMSQWGVTLKHFYNKDNPGDLPPAEKVKVKKNGKVVEDWDFTAQTEFLINKMRSEFLPMLKPAKVVAREKNVEAIQNSYEPEEGGVISQSFADPVSPNDGPDDLPF